MEISALLLLLLLIISFAQFILIFMLLEKGQKPMDAMEKRANLVMEETEKKGHGIIYGAMKKAQEIVSNAEVEGIKTAASAKLRTTQFEKDYEERLSEAVDKSQREIEKIVRDNIAKSMAGFDLKLAEVISKIENERLKEAGAKSDATKAEIEEYRKTRLARLDDQIAKIVAETVIKTLDKKIDLNTQMQTIYDALERAKAENFVS